MCNVLQPRVRDVFTAVQVQGGELENLNLQQGGANSNSISISTLEQIKQCVIGMESARAASDDDADTTHGLFD